MLAVNDMHTALMVRSVFTVYSIDIAEQISKDNMALGLEANMQELRSNLIRVTVTTDNAPAVRTNKVLGSLVRTTKVFKATQPKFNKINSELPKLDRPKLTDSNTGLVQSSISRMME